MIKNIIFDFGDVFINLDKDATINELSELGVNNISPTMMQQYYNYEKGLISTDKFVEYFQNELKIDTAVLIKAWNAILLDFPLERLQFLKELRDSKKYRLFLLSNTNDLHISWIKTEWGMELYNEFKNCFERFYLSHEIHMRKPNTNIFEFVMTENNLIPEETIFIDDTRENTKAAEQLNIKSWTIDRTKENIINLLKLKEFSL